MSRSLHPEEWQRKVRKGRKLYDDFFRSVNQVPQSPWMDWKSFRDNGWEDHSYLDFYKGERMKDLTELVPQLKGFMQEFGFDASLTTGRWKNCVAAHDKAGEAQYGHWISKKHSDNILLLRTEAYSPKYKIKEKGLSRSLEPDLKQWSDVAALQYYYHMSSAGRVDVHPPRWFVITQITEGESKTDTLETFRTAHQVARKEPRKWPGVEFNPAENEAAFSGLLGSVHASGPAFFLLDHKQWFGSMGIDRIIVWEAKVGDNGPTIYSIALSVVPFR